MRERASASRSPASASAPWSPSPWPTSRCSGSKRASTSRGGVSRSRRWTPARSSPARKNRFAPTASATTSVRCSSHQSARSRQRARLADRDRLERRPRERVRRDDVRHPQLAGERGAVAVVAVEELEDGDRVAELACARESAGSCRTGSTSQTRPSAASACDVRVIGSSTIHEKPCAPRSSQKRIVIERGYAPRGRGR